jgi:hypothetical protein
VSAKGGRLEATITVPVGGWDMAANNGGGAFTATVPAGDYTFREFVVAVEAALDAGPGADWILSVSYGEAASQQDRVTILPGAAGSITWTDTEVRDILGFAGNLASATSHVGSLHPIGYWRPVCPKKTPYGDGVWHRQSDLRQTQGPAGAVKTLSGNSFQFLDGVSWSHVAGARAVGDATVGTWQHFWRMTMLGLYSYITPGKPIAVYWDADLTSFDEAYMVAPPSSALPPVVDGWTGLYRVDIPKLNKVA